MPGPAARYDQTRPSWIGEQLLQEGSRIAGPDFRGSFGARRERLEGDEDGARVGALVKVAPEKPDQIDAWVNPGQPERPIPAIRRLTSSVRVSEAPLGSCRYDDEVTLVDLGNEPIGVLRNSLETDRITPAYTTSITAAKRTTRAASQP